MVKTYSLRMHRDWVCGCGVGRWSMIDGLVRGSLMWSDLYGMIYKSLCFEQGSPVFSLGGAGRSGYGNGKGTVCCRCLP